jgi:hypothetical protein
MGTSHSARSTSVIEVPGDHRLRKNLEAVVAQAVPAVS